MFQFSIRLLGSYTSCPNVHHAFHWRVWRGMRRKYYRTSPRFLLHLDFTYSVSQILHPLDIADDLFNAHVVLDNLFPKNILKNAGHDCTEQVAAWFRNLTRYNINDWKFYLQPRPMKCDEMRTPQSWNAAHRHHDRARHDAGRHLAGDPRGRRLAGRPAGRDRGALQGFLQKTGPHKVLKGFW